MKITYKNSIDDLLKLNMDIFRKDSSVQKRVILNRILFPIIVIALFILVTRGHKIYIPFLIFCLIVILLWIIYYPKIAEFQYKRLLVKRLNNLKYNNIEQTLIVNKNGIVQENKNENIKVLWQDIEGINDINTHVFIYMNDLSAIVIPSNAFKNEEEKKVLLDILYKNIER